MALKLKKRLGEMLVDKGLIDQMQLQSAIGRQKQWGGRFGSNLVKLGYISEITLIKFLSNQLKLPCADLAKIRFTPNAYSLITVEVSKKYHIIPIETRDDGSRKILFLAMSEPTNMLALDEVSFLTGMTIRPVIATDSQIGKAIDKYYNNRDWVEIDPLSEKITTAEEASPEIIHEVTMKEKREIQKKTKTVAKNPELLALVRVLVKKGLITRDEYIKELEQLKE